MLSLTDSASASQYGLQTARLSRAGDDKSDRRFIAADTAAIAAGIEAMAPRSEPAVLEPDPTAVKPTGYPLTALTYAAVAPLSLDQAARNDYAAFIDYAAGPGQVPGLELGQLPRGYAPLPATLRAQATAAAKIIRELKPAAPPTETPSKSTPAKPLPAKPTPTTPLRSNSPTSGRDYGAVAATSSPSGSTSGTTQLPPTEQANRPIVSATDAPTRSSGPASPVATPFLALARSRFVLPVLAAIAVLSAWGSLEITKRPRWRGEVTASTREPFRRRGKS